MKEKPILFSTDMVRAILEGRKTMTRRAVKMYHQDDHPNRQNAKWFEENKTCPYGKPGDILWVKESFYAWGKWVKNGKTKSGKQKWKFIDLTGEDFQYKYEDCKPHRIKRGTSRELGWYKRPSLFMPKAAARIWLQVEHVRVERLQDISEAEAKKEGIYIQETGFYCWHNDASLLHSAAEAKPAFKKLWQSINGPDSWKQNPCVWVISFKVLSTTGKPEFINP